MAHPLTKFHFIETDELNRIVRQLQTAVTICEQAQSLSLEEHHDRPETSYAGASGWSAGAMRNALITLTHLIDGAKLYGEDEEEKRQSSQLEVLDVSASSV